MNIYKGVDKLLAKFNSQQNCLDSEKINREIPFISENCIFFPRVLQIAAYPGHQLVTFQLVIELRKLQHCCQVQLVSCTKSENYVQKSNNGQLEMHTIYISSKFTQFLK